MTPIISSKDSRLTVSCSFKLNTT